MNTEIPALILDETIIQSSNQHFRLWICIEPILNSVHRIYISEERNMFVAENFIHSLVDKYGKHTVYTDGCTWYPHACTFLHLKYRLHSPLEKSMIERLIKYFKDRTESFEDYYSCNNKQNCGLQHVYNWIKMIIYLYNTKIKKYDSSQKLETK